MFGQGVARSAFDTLPRQNNARPESPPRRSDPSSVSDTPAHRSLVPSAPAPLRRPPPLPAPALPALNFLCPLPPPPNSRQDPPAPPGGPGRNPDGEGGACAAQQVRRTALP